MPPIEAILSKSSFKIRTEEFIGEDWRIVTLLLFISVAYSDVTLNTKNIKYDAQFVEKATGDATRKATFLMHYSMLCDKYPGYE